MATSPIQLQVQTVFGVRSKLESSLAFVDEQTIVYPAGNQFVLANVETKSQQVFRCPELEHAEWISVDSGAAVLAIIWSRSTNDKNNIMISFYDLHTNLGKRKRMFALGPAPMNIVSLAFSHDAKHMAIIDGREGDYTISLWFWQKCRLIASLKPGANDNMSGLTQVLFYPKDNNQMSVIGRRTSRLIRNVDGNLRIIPPSSKLDQYSFTCHCKKSTRKMSIDF